MGAQEAPKGAPRSAKATKMVPKVMQKGAKSDFEIFFEISETLIFDDSTLIFMVFWCPGGSPIPPRGIGQKGVKKGSKVGQKGVKKLSFWAPFWSPLRSLGLLWAPLGLPKRCKSPKKNEKRGNK